MKKIKLKSKDLVKILKDQKKINKEIQGVHKELVDADKRHKKLAFKVQRIKDKGVKILHKELLKQYKMDELDYSGEMEVLDDKTSEVTINNLFDDMFGDPDGTKKAMIEQKKKKEGLWKEKNMFTGHK